jgi:ribosomal protein S12 methylthiotransferase accessory factor
MMESAENWHAEHIESPTQVESYWRLSERAHVIDIFEIPLRAGATLRPEVPMVWIEGYDLLSRQMIWMPYECVTMNTVVKFALTLTFYTSSNGLASGNHILEAINHALFEVIERDSHAEWLDRSEAVRRTTKVDPSSITDPECQTMLHCFESAGLSVAIWDITSAEFEIPVYLAQVVGQDEGPTWRRVGLCSGRGCHLSPVVALSRALSEAAQSRLTIISGSRDDNLPETYENQIRESLFEKWKRQYFDPLSVLRFGERTDRSTDSLESDLDEILFALRRKHITQAAVVDLSQSGIGIPVVKVVVPGLSIANEAGERVATPAIRKGQA